MRPHAGRKKGTPNKPKTYAEQAAINIRKQRVRLTKAQLLQNKLYRENRQLLQEALKAVRDGTAVPPLEAVMAALQAGFDSGNTQLMLTSAALVLPYTNARLVRAEMVSQRDNGELSEAELLDQMRQLRRNIDSATRRIDTAKVIDVEAEPAE